jgi:hypothetical protein
LPYALSRFQTVRTTYGLIRSVERISPDAGPLHASLFPALDVAAAVQSLRQRAVFDKFSLPTQIVKELQNLAYTSRLKQRGNDRVFHYQDVVEGKLPDGSKAILASVIQAAEDSTVRRISEDPQVLAIVAAYLRYAPKQRDIRFLCSFVSNASSEERRRKGQTIDFHFDFHSYNFVYANYYISEVDETAGAHVMVEGSHKHKPLRWLMGSVRQSEAALRKHYGDDKVMTITGAAGFAFIQDSSCYHKAVAPLTRDRLMLQVRYF